MYKMKTKKSAAKRFKVLGSGKIRRNKANKRHLLSSKNRNRKNQLKKPAYVHKANAGLIRDCLPNG